MLSNPNIPPLREVKSLMKLYAGLSPIALVDHFQGDPVVGCRRIGHQRIALLSVERAVGDKARPTHVACKDRALEIRAFVANDAPVIQIAEAAAFHAVEHAVDLAATPYSEI